MRKLLLALGAAALMVGTMAPSYNTQTPAIALNQGNQVQAFNTEQPTSGTLSQQFYVPAASENGPAVPAISVEVVFSGAPGAFEFDIYEADSDVQTSYLQIPAAGSINAVSANNVARVDLSPFVGSYIAIYCKTQTANAVNATVRITRRS